MKLRAGLGCLVLIGISIGGYIAAHTREPDPPRWTEADIPRPPPDHNGWVHVARHPIDSIPEPVREGVLRALDEEPPSWELIDARVAAMDPSIVASSDVLRELVIAEPRFFDGCPLHFDTTCSLVETLGLWNHFRVEILIERSPELAVVVWRHAADFTTSCRSVVGCILGLQLLKRTLRTAAWLIHHQAEELGVLRSALAEFELPRDQFQRAIIGDYIEKQPLFLTDELPLFVDRAQTMRFLAHDFEAVHAYAARDGTPRPRARRYGDGTLWWLYNREGKHLLDVLETISTLSDYTERYWEEVDALDSARRDLLQQMN